MPSELKSLQEFFNKRVFRIPDYQRGFSWGVNQLSDFWQDLNRIPPGRNHYTGQITLEAVPQEKWQKWDEDPWLITGSNYKPFYVVDGQQRLTTSVILLKCLLDSVPDNEVLAFTPKPELIGTYLFRQAGVSKDYLFGYEKDNPSYEFLKTEILGQSSNSAIGTETVYTSNLRFARDFFKERLKKYNLTEVNDVFRRLTQRFVFNEYELDENLDVFITFETMNNRGKALSKLELLKNRLIYLSTIIDEDKDQQLSLRRNINNAWKTIYEYLGKESGQSLDDDDFLRAHWIMYFVYSREESEQYAKFLLESKFTSTQVLDKKLSSHEIQAYVNSIQSSAKSWYAIHFPYKAENLTESVRKGLARVDRVEGKTFQPLIMGALQEHPQELTLISLLNCVERYTFLLGRFSRRKADIGDSEFYRLAGELHRKDQSLNSAIAVVQARAADDFSLEKAKSKLRELFEKNGGGYYAWSGRHYFLFEYEEYLKGNSGMNAAKISWEEFTTSKKDYVTIEHIYPQSPISGEWPLFDAFSEKERIIIRNSLGNLLALSQSRNSKFSNRAFLVRYKTQIQYKVTIMVPIVK